MKRALEERLTPLRVTEGEDRVRAEGGEGEVRLAGMYRRRQREVLEEAVETLGEMLEGAVEESDGDGESSK